MRNHPQPNKRKRFFEIINNPNLDLCKNTRIALQTHTETLERFFSNIEYLRIRKGESCYRMLKTIERDTDGFRISAPCYSMLRSGKTKICGIYVLAVLSAYFERDINELMFIDIRSLDSEAGTYIPEVGESLELSV